MFDVKNIRPLVNINAPKPSNVSAESVYNFFVPDERTSEESSSRYLGATQFTVQANNTDGKNRSKIFFKDSRGRVTAEENIVGEVPRYNILRFQAPRNIPGEAELNYDLEEKYSEGVFQTSDEIHLPFDISLQNVDLALSKRMSRKLDLAIQLEKSNNVKSFTEVKRSDSTFTNQTIQKLDPGGTYHDRLQLSTGMQPFLPKERVIMTSLVNLNSTAATENVNEIGDEFSLGTTISDAQFMNLTTKVDRRLLAQSLSSPLARDNRFYRQILNEFVESDKPALLTLPSPQDPALREIYLDAEGYDVTNEKVIPKITLAGFMIERYEIDETIQGHNPERTYFISTPFANNFIDPSIKYGIYYTYTVRAVYKIVNSVFLEGVEKKVIAFLASESSDSVETRVLETTPPAEPDGVQFRFNYNRRKGLMLFWQFPVGKQRDTKYFQIFRRKNIDEPFTCIAMLDFDNSTIKSQLREYITPTNILKYDESITYYEDNDFLKDSKFIYAVAAIDAHGYSSGYSAQTKVEFDKSRNTIILNTVSQPGAPKQYPNFFVDPDEDRNVFVNALTQDSMKSSFFKKMKVYFDPDGMKYTHSKMGDVPGYIFRSNTLGTEKNVTPESGLYKLVVINTDRQKSSTIEIRIDDARDSGFFT